MVKNHIKRLTIPNTWKGVGKKENKYIIKTAPGPHPIEMSMPLGVIFKQLGIAKTTKECKYILHNKTVQVDGRRIKDDHFPVGLYDVISLVDSKKHYRMMLDNKGKLEIVDAGKSANTKTCRIRGKKVLAKGKVQLNLSDGRNVLVDKDEYKVGDSVVLEIPSQKITKKLDLALKANVILTGGKHRGDYGQVASIEGQSLTYKNKDGKEIKTLREYAYVVQA